MTRTHRCTTILACLMAASGCSGPQAMPPEEAPRATAAAATSTPEPAPPPAPPAPTASAAAPVDDTPAVDDKGCVRNARKHGLAFILDHYAKDIAERLGHAPTPADFAEPTTCFGSGTIPDLDGDGADETEVTEGCTWGMHGWIHVLYLSNKGCPRFAGDLIESELRPLETKNAGVRDVEATWSGGCAGHDFSWTHYRWNGKAYKAIDKATCYFCDDPSISTAPPGANQHPHCKKEAKLRALPQ